MKKRWLAVLCLVLCLGFTACGKKDDGAQGAGADPTGVPEATPTAAEAAPTREADPTPTAEPTKEAEPAPTDAAEPTKEAEPTPAEGETGKSDTTYSSETYGFSVVLPENFMIFDEETTLGIMYQSLSVLYESVDAMMEAFDALGIKYPFVASTTEPLNANASANVIAQLIPSSMMPGTLEEVVEGSLDSSVQQYEALGVTPVIGTPEILDVNGVEVCVADSSILLDGNFAGVNYEKFNVYQKYVCFNSGSNLVILSCTYYTEEEGTAVNEMINTIQLLP